MKEKVANSWKLNDSFVILYISILITNQRITATNLIDEVEKLKIHFDTARELMQQNVMKINE